MVEKKLKQPTTTAQLEKVHLIVMAEEEEKHKSLAYRHACKMRAEAMATRVERRIKTYLMTYLP